MLGRSLLIWGWGHLAIGDRRGWLLLALQVLALAAVGLLGATLIEGSRGIVVFLAASLYLALWTGQAIDAHRRAVALGATPGGAIRILAVAPVAIVALTLLWTVVGSAGSPAAVLQRYVSAWRQGHADAGRELFRVAPEPGDLDATWRDQTGYVASRLTSLRMTYGSTSGIDPADPFGSLLFLPDAPGRSDPPDLERAGERATVAIQAVRRQTVRSSFFGLFPTASQESVPAERVGSVTLVAIEREPLLGLARGVVWRIESVDLPPH